MLKVRFLFVFIVSAVFTLNAAQDSLRKYADKIGMNLGTCVSASYLSITNYTNVLKRDFNTVVCENEMKPDATEPTQGTFSFTNSDAIVSFAQQNNMKVRGHTLVWHNQNPSWLSSGSWTRATLLAAMKEHINGVLSHFKGKCFEWDVVNEAFDGASYRSSFWYNTIGADFIDSAFVYAHQADSSALLFYNDYSTSTVNDKSTAIYNKVKTMLENHIPIHGVGFQSHQITTEYSSSMYSSLKTNFDRFAALGLKISITELDVRMALPSDASKLLAQANMYKAFMQAALGESKLGSFMIWGFTDNYSWIPSTFSGYGAALIYDASYVAKPAYDSLLVVLKNAASSTGINFIGRAIVNNGAENVIYYDRVKNAVFVNNTGRAEPVVIDMFDLRGTKITTRKVTPGSGLMLSNMPVSRQFYIVKTTGGYAVTVRPVK